MQNSFQECMQQVGFPGGPYESLAEKNTAVLKQGVVRSCDVIQVLTDPFV